MLLLPGDVYWILLKNRHSTELISQVQAVFDAASERKCRDAWIEGPCCGIVLPCAYAARRFYNAVRSLGIALLDSIERTLALKSDSCMQASRTRRRHIASVRIFCACLVRWDEHANCFMKVKPREQNAKVWKDFKCTNDPVFLFISERTLSSTSSPFHSKAFSRQWIM